MFSFVNILHIVIIFQSLLLGLYILSQKKKSLSHILLATLMLAIAIQFIGLFLSNREIKPGFFQSLNSVYGFLYGPLFLLYSRSITRKGYMLSLNALWHLLPAGVMATALIITHGRVIQPEAYLGYAIHILTYLAFCFIEVRQYKKAIKDNRSRLELLMLDWLQWVFAIFLATIALDLAQYSIHYFSHNSYPFEIAVFMLILGSLNILYLKGYKPATEFGGISEEERSYSSSLTSNRQFGLSQEEKENLLEKIRAYMDEAAPYKNPNLTIAQLAYEIGIPKRTLSEAINDAFKQNFVDFINTYRIELAKSRLKNPSSTKETILEVLYEVGFNSKSAFNAAFKSKTGLTPTQFKSKHQQ